MHCRPFLYVARVKYHSIGLVMLNGPICSGSMGLFQVKISIYRVAYEALSFSGTHTHQAFYFSPQTLCLYFRDSLYFYSLARDMAEWLTVDQGRLQTAGLQNQEIQLEVLGMRGRVLVESHN